MKTAVHKPDASDEFYTEERCAILEILNGSDDPDVSIARARVEPGVTTAWHSLTGVAERYLMLSGVGRVEVGDLAPVAVGPGDLVRIPAGVRQRITNTSAASDLVFYAICTPRFTPDCYRDLESDSAEPG